MSFRGSTSPPVQGAHIRAGIGGAHLTRGLVIVGVRLEPRAQAQHTDVVRRCSQGFVGQRPRLHASGNQMFILGSLAAFALRSEASLIQGRTSGLPAAKSIVCASPSNT